MKKVHIILAATLIGFFISASTYCEVDTMLRVRVARDKKSLSLSIKGPYIIETINTGEKLFESKKSLKKAKVYPTKLGIKIGKKEYPIFAVRIVPSVKGEITIDKRLFRGVIDVIRTKNKRILVINHIDVEDYLYGVLYYETPHYWPMEVLMAQAIAARTYALYTKKEMAGKEYDLTNDTFSQMYGGKKGERWKTRRAVDLTKNEVLTYKGNIFPTYYHSICGGHTEDSAELWKIKLEPLLGRKCGYCKKAPGYYWRTSYSYKQIEGKLNKAGIKCKHVSYILEGQRDRSGRLKTVRIKDASGIKNIPSNKFRLALGGTSIKSTNFIIEIKPAGILFRGKGWGHGVGMCQWGALTMAMQGHDHEQIVRFYYPKSKVKKLK